MAIEYLERDGRGDYVSCTECPFCGEELSERQSLAKHIRGHCEEADSDV